MFFSSYTSTHKWKAICSRHPQYDYTKGLSQQGKIVSTNTIPIWVTRSLCHSPATCFMSRNGSMDRGKMAGISCISPPSASTLTCVLYKFLTSAGKRHVLYTSLLTASAWLVFYVDLKQNLVKRFLFQESSPSASKMTCVSWESPPSTSKLSCVYEGIHP